MSNDKKIRMAVISGASLALKLKNEHRMATDPEILQEISHEMDDIVSKIDKDL